MFRITEQMYEGAAVSGASGKRNPSEISSESEISLLLEAASGSEKAFNRLAEIYSPLLRSAVFSMSSGLKEQDVEELSQEALLAFHRAVRNYDPLYENVTFGLYAKICVINGLRSELKRLKKEESVPIITLDSIPDSDLPSSDPAETEDRAEELRRMIRSSLSDFENRVFWFYYAGMTCSEISEKTGKSPKSVENALFRIRKKLKKLLSS